MMKYSIFYCKELNFYYIVILRSMKGKSWHDQTYEKNVYHDGEIALNLYISQEDMEQIEILRIRISNQQST